MVKTLKNEWMNEQFDKIKTVVGNDFSDERIKNLLEKKWSERKEPKYTFEYTKDSINLTSVENMMDKFLNSNYVFSAYGVLYKQPTEHKSIFNDVLWEVIGERKEIRKYIAERRKKDGDVFMANEFVRYDSRQKNRKIVVNAAYGVIASWVSVFFNNGLLMSTTQNSITKTGQTLTTIVINSIEQWLENNFDFANISDLIDYILWAKKYYYKHKELNEKYLIHLEDVTSETFINYLLNKIESPTKVDLNYLKFIDSKLTDTERKSIYYRNNIPAISEQKYWKELVDKILTESINKNKKAEEETLKEFNDFVFNTSIMDFIHPERFPRQWHKTRDTAIISDTDSVFITVYRYVNEIKKYFKTNKISERDLDLSITKLFISISDVFIKYILHSYLNFMNVSDERKADISMKSEFDYSKILVSAKKTYAGWKVGELSVPLGDNSEIDIKGLTIKKSTVVRSLREKFSNILENYVLNVDKIDTLEILNQFEEIEADIRAKLSEGSTEYLQPASVSGDGAYDDPTRMPAWRGVQIWNIVNPSQAIDLPGRVMQIRLEPLDDYEFLKEDNPEIYEKLTDILKNRIDLLGTKYDGNSKKKSNKKNVLDIISIPYQLEKIPEWIIPLIDIELIVDRLMKPGQFILNAIGVSTPDNYVTNIVDRRIINQILI